MKRTDIRAGVVYAVKSSYGSPAPVMFLEDRAAGLYSRAQAGGIRQHEENSHTKARRGQGFGSYNIGYVILKQDWMSAGTEPLPLPWQVDPDAELERFRAGEKPSVKGLTFDIITSVAKIAPWDATVAVAEAREAAETEARAKADAGRAKARAACDALLALGVNAKLSFGSHKIELDIWEAEKLIALLAAKEED
jgi:hypothetical protein